MFDEQGRRRFGASRVLTSALELSRVHAAVAVANSRYLVAKSRLCTAHPHPHPDTPEFRDVARSRGFSFAAGFSPPGLMSVLAWALFGPVGF